jgi:hypothetical protein
MGLKFRPSSSTISTTSANYKIANSSQPNTGNQPKQQQQTANTIQSSPAIKFNTTNKWSSYNHGKR